jgi:hypothetical protein
MSLIPDSRQTAAAGSWSGAATKLLLIAALVLTLALAVFGRMWLPQQWLAPMVATVLFAAALVAALCSSRSRNRSNTRVGWLDMAGILTGIGIVLSLLVEPEDTVQFVQNMTRRD